MADDFCLAIFPFLKTSSPVVLGGFTFQPTDKAEGLTPEQFAAVSEVSAMLFLRDDLRISSASFSVISNLNSNDTASPEMMRLSNVQDAVSYLYAAPQPMHGDVFLSPEHASIAVFKNDRVSTYNIKPEFNVHDTGAPLDVDPRGFVAGFSGLYNFKHFFCVARGSRLYGPQPYLTLNISQNLFDDIKHWRAERPHFGLLFDMLAKPPTDFSLRIFSAIRWFNGSCRSSIGDDEALANLSIAFEALLALPQGEKTDRLVDAISLLLGRNPRLHSWARQFYDARSRIIHEGRAETLHFMTPRNRNSDAGGQLHRALLTFGRQIFRLCLGTLLTGSHLAEQFGLEERLTGNQERYEKICKLVGDTTSPACDRLASVGALVDSIERYRFSAETITLDTMIDAVKLAAKTLLVCGTPATIDESALQNLVAAKRGRNRLNELVAVDKVDAALRASASASGEDTESAAIFRKLFEVVWMKLFFHYHWLTQSH